MVSSIFVLSWSRSSRSSPLTLKMSAFVFAASRAERPGVQQRVEQPGRERGLRGDAADPRDGDVRAAGAVEEVRVEEHGLAVAARTPGALGGPCRRSTGPGRGPRRRRAAPRRPGRGGTNTSGSTRVTVTSAASCTCAGSRPAGDVEDVGVELGAFVPGAHGGDDPGDADRADPGHLAFGGEHVVELGVRLLADTDPERQGRRVLCAEHAAHRFTHPSDPRRSYRRMRFPPASRTCRSSSGRASWIGAALGDAHRTGPDQERRERQVEFVREVGGDELAEDVRPALAEDLAQAPVAQGRRSRRRSRPRRCPPR